MRLRNLGGLVIIDFIDMKNRGDQRKVFQKMKNAMSDDKAKHNILPISELGLCKSLVKGTMRAMRVEFTNPVPIAKGVELLSHPLSEYRDSEISIQCSQTGKSRNSTVYQIKGIFTPVRCCLDYAGRMHRYSLSWKKKTMIYKLVLKVRRAITWKIIKWWTSPPRKKFANL